MKLCRLVISQDLSASKLYDSPVSPLMHYLVIRKTNEKAEGFCGPMEYTNIHWSEDKETVYFVARLVHLAKIGPMRKVLVNELKESMSTLAFEDDC